MSASLMIVKQNSKIKQRSQLHHITKLQMKPQTLRSPADVHTVHTNGDVTSLRTGNTASGELSSGPVSFKQVGRQILSELAPWSSHAFPNGKHCSGVSAMHGQL